MLNVSFWVSVRKSRELDNDMKPSVKAPINLRIEMPTSIYLPSASNLANIF